MWIIQIQFVIVRVWWWIEKKKLISIPPKCRWITQKVIEWMSQSLRAYNISMGKKTRLKKISLKKKFMLIICVTWSGSLNLLWVTHFHVGMLNAYFVSHKSAHHHSYAIPHKTNDDITIQTIIFYPNMMCYCRFVPTFI